MTIIPVLARKKQDYKFKVILVYIENFRLV
jgi:hypothetical protein